MKENPKILYAITCSPSVKRKRASGILPTIELSEKSDRSDMKINPKPTNKATMNLTKHLNTVIIMSAHIVCGVKCKSKEF